MSSPLLAGGLAVGLAACEEPRKPGAPSPGLPPQCPYYTTEGWGAPALMAPTPGQRSFTRLQQAPQAAARAHFNQPDPEEQASDPPEELDSHIDFCLESLNQLILELDPTFQLLPPGPGMAQAEPARRTTSRIKKEEPEALGKHWDLVPGGRLGTCLLRRRKLQLLGSQSWFPSGGAAQPKARDQPLCFPCCTK